MSLAKSVLASAGLEVPQYGFATQAGDTRGGQ